MNITKLVGTETDGSTAEIDVSSPLTKIVATLDNGSEKVLFDSANPPIVGDITTIPVKTDGTLVKFVPA